MQPSSGGFWQPDNTHDAPNHDSAAASHDKIFQSNYDGYELTEPEQKPAAHQDTVEVEWEASEYIQHDKDAAWFIILIAIAAVLLGVALLFKQWTFAAVIVAMTVSIIVYARRPPRTLHYRLDFNNFSIEGKPYTYTDFKAFGLTQDGPLHMVTLLPRKRFAPPVSMYFDQEDGEKIVDILGAHMPLEPLKPDIFDDLVRKLRF